jgi:hypothetical protein
MLYIRVPKFINIILIVSVILFMISQLHFFILDIFNPENPKNGAKNSRDHENNKPPHPTTLHLHFPNPPGYTGEIPKGRKSGRQDDYDEVKAHHKLYLIRDIDLCAYN